MFIITIANTLTSVYKHVNVLSYRLIMFWIYVALFNFIYKWQDAYEGLVSLFLIDISSPFPANEAKYAVRATSTVNVLKLHFGTID